MADKYEIREYVECACSANEHRVVFVHDLRDKDFPVYITNFLDLHLPWHKRIFVAIKYVLGFKGKVGHFDYTLLDLETIKKLHKFLTTVRAVHENSLS